MTFPVARNKVIPQPLGVVGVIAPWNFPINLTFAPLAAIFAAGNRAMVKMSENSQHLAELLVALSPKYFAEEKLQVLRGWRWPGTRLLVAALRPHSVHGFRDDGSGSHGQRGAQSDARDVGRSAASRRRSSPRIFPSRPRPSASCGSRCSTRGKFAPTSTTSSCPRAPRRSSRVTASDCSPSVIPTSTDPTSHRSSTTGPSRGLQATLEDARAKGATLINLAEGQIPDASLRKFPPHLVLDPTEDMQVMQREIFGPILPIRTYATAGSRGLYQRPRSAVGDLPVHQRCANPRFLYLAGDVGRRIRQRGAAACRPARSSVWRRRRQRHGPLSRAEGFITFSKLRPVFYQGPFPRSK